MHSMCWWLIASHYHEHIFETPPCWQKESPGWVFEHTWDCCEQERDESSFSQRTKTYPEAQMILIFCCLQLQFLGGQKSSARTIPTRYVVYLHLWKGAQVTSLNIHTLWEMFGKLLLKKMSVDSSNLDSHFQQAVKFRTWPCCGRLCSTSHCRIWAFQLCWCGNLKTEEFCKPKAQFRRNFTNCAVELKGY